MFRQGQFLVGVTAAALGTAACGSPYKIAGMEAETRYEVKLKSKFSRNREERVVEGPAIEFTAPLRSGLDASLAIGGGRVSGKGWGKLDTELAVKWELLPLGEREARLGVTIEPAAVFADGSRGLSDGERRFVLPVILGIRLGKAGLRTMLGWEHGVSRHGHSLKFGWVGTYRLNDRLSLGVEYLGEGARSRSADFRSSADIGFTYGLTPSIELQGRIGRSLHTPDHVGTVQTAVFLAFLL